MKVFYTLFLFLGISLSGFSQLCGGGTNQGTLVPTTTTQTTGIVNSGRPYWTFAATAGCTYTFATCGLSGSDTYLWLHNGAGGGAVLASNDDGCGSQSTITWYCTASGTYTIFITRYGNIFTGNCNTLNANVQLSYVMNCTLSTTNCLGATQVCTDVAFSGNSSGSGAQELTNANKGCLGVEHQSSWYYFQPVTSGTVSLTITTTVDYDFAIWSGTCSNLGTPIRCSYAAGGGNTGLGNGAADLSEDAYGNRWVAPLAVTAGQTYIMLIDNFTSSSTAFTLDWTFSSGATLNCMPVVLPLDLIEFTGNYQSTLNANILSWKTGTERDNDYFTLERSANGSNWATICKETGAGDSYTEIDYEFADNGFEEGKINYYRLSQTDFNGKKKTFDIISVSNLTVDKKIIKVCNMMGQEITPDSKGVVILLYDDGTTQRVLRQ